MDNTIRHIGELTTNGVFIYDLQVARFLYLNDNFAKILCLSRQQLLDDPGKVLPLIRSEDDNYLRHRYQELLNTQVISGTEFRVHFSNGAMKHLSMDAYLINGGGQVAGFLKDCTREKEHEDYIINYGAKKDTLLDMITHNLSGPLNLSKNLLALMQQNQDHNKQDNTHSHLYLVQSTTQECLDIINDFLREEHMESETIYVKKTRFDVVERIIATLEKLIATNKTKRFRVLNDIENLNINTDSVKFFQIVHNLVSNAIKFTPDNGNIDIIIEETPETFIIRVRDDGIGISTELQPRLFEKKTPAARRGLKDEGSKGMGLHIVRTLVDLLGGRVWVESEVNKGTTFSVELPKE